MIRKRVFLAIIIFFLLLSTHTPSYVSASDMIQVSANILNVRETNSTTGAVVTQVRSGERYEVLERKGDWIKIKVSNSLQGWVAGFLVTSVRGVTATANQSTGTNGTITTDGLRVRSGPGMNHSVVTVLSNKNKVTVLETKDNWLKIRFHSHEGWISKDFIAIDQQSGAPSTNTSTSTILEITTNSLNVRSEPNTTSTIVGKLQKGNRVSVVNSRNNWYEISHNSIKGWIHQDYTKVVTNSSNSTTLTSKQSATVTASSLNVRDSGSLNGKVISSLTKGSKVSVLRDVNSWTEIEYNNGKKGWVAGWYLEKLDSPSSPNTVNGNVVVLHNGTNIRKSPSTNSAVVARANARDQFQIIGMEKDWYKISLRDGSEAYIAGWIVQTLGNVPTVTRTGSSSPLKNKTIVIDAGHGGKDVGAIGVSGAYEKDITIRTAKLLYDKLVAAGANVHMTRNNDTSISLRDRVQVSHRQKADAFISVHYDSIDIPSVRGTTTYYLSNESKKLAEHIHNALIQSTNLRDRKVNKGNFLVLRENKQPSVLLELGYISNREEEAIILSADYQNKAATAIFQGLLQHFR
ncbi:MULTISPECIES: SH3 domain-containing protein [Bacillus]|uniref:SH3 domain-containing protein n=1 Tax=Bacillus TaxID=1386 RepID=UPI000BB97687|nr:MULTISPECIES: SH3 domain-containing protein [Bacillus]